MRPWRSAALMLALGGCDGQPAPIDGGEGGTPERIADPGHPEIREGPQSPRDRYERRYVGRYGPAGDCSGADVVVLAPRAIRHDGRHCRIDEVFFEGGSGLVVDTARCVRDGRRGDGARFRLERVDRERIRVIGPDGGPETVTRCDPGAGEPARPRGKR